MKEMVPVDVVTPQEERELAAQCADGNAHRVDGASVALTREKVVSASVIQMLFDPKHTLLGRRRFTPGPGVSL